MPLTNEERNYLKLLGGNIVKKRKERGIKQKELSSSVYEHPNRQRLYHRELMIY